MQGIQQEISSYFDPNSLREKNKKNKTEKEAHNWNKSLILKF